MQFEVLAPRKMKTKFEWKRFQNGIESASNRLSALLAHLTVSPDQLEVKAMTIRNLIYKFSIQRWQFDFCLGFFFVFFFCHFGGRLVGSTDKETKLDEGKLKRLKARHSFNYL